METREKTIRRPVTLKGTGLHTGAKVALKLSPAPEGTGIRFKGTESGEWRVESGEGAGKRRTRVQSEGAVIETVEHLLSAVSGLGICNLLVDVEGPEIPALDGSAVEFVRAFRRAGLLSQKRNRDVWAVREPLFVSEGLASLGVLPHSGFRVTYTLDYPHPRLKARTVSFEVGENYAAEIAPARTFCTEEESVFLRQKGFGKGADFKNTLVISAAGPVKNRLRFPDECARHKVLDLIGDLALAAFAMKGHFIGVRSGHNLNRRLLGLILEQKKGSKS